MTNIDRAPLLLEEVGNVGIRIQRELEVLVVTEEEWTRLRSAVVKLPDLYDSLFEIKSNKGYAEERL